MSTQDAIPFWIDPNRKPKSQLIEGLPICAAFDEKNVRDTITHKPTDGTLLIATYPKCGTTWTQMIVYLIHSGGIPPESVDALMASQPYLEFNGIEGVVDRRPTPPAFKTHLPFNLAPFNPKAKYIYVVRNPWDTCVSYFHFLRYVPGYMFWNGYLNTFAELFVKGEAGYGDYFKHVTSWWEQRTNYPTQMLFLTFEDMKRDVKGAILEVAKFMGEDYHMRLLQNPEILEKCIKYCGFDYMKQLNSSGHISTPPTIDEIQAKAEWPPGLKRTRINMTKAKEEIKRERIALGLDPDSSLGEFFRKGEVNNWQNELSEHHVRQIGHRFDEAVKSHEIDKMWKSLDWMSAVRTVS